MDLQYMAERLSALGCRVRLREPMADHTSFRIGGPADLFVITGDVEQTLRVLCLCEEEDVPILILGNGSNLLVSDDGIAGVVLQQEALPPVTTGTTITASAGMSLKKLCLHARDNGLSGLEFAYGIPGTVGGAVYMNAGAYGGEMAHVVSSATVLLADGTVKRLSAEELAFGYRHSLLMEQPWTVVSVEVSLQPEESVTIRARMDEILSRRREKQPLEYPSGGSFFKRPEGHFAGALIEACDLKGYTVGGAQVSEKHAGFVINRGGATCADVMTLCRYVQETVQERFGVMLEREVQLVGR